MIMHFIFNVQPCLDPCASEMVQLQFTEVKSSLHNKNWYDHSKTMMMIKRLKIKEMEFGMDQIYNVDESGDYYKLLLEKEYATTLENSTSNSF